MLSDQATDQRKDTKSFVTGVMGPRAVKDDTDGAFCRRAEPVFGANGPKRVPVHEFPGWRGGSSPEFIISPLALEDLRVGVVGGTAARLVDLALGRDGQRLAV